jgi:hypothetical protein
VHPTEAGDAQKAWDTQNTEAFAAIYLACTLIVQNLWDPKTSRNAKDLWESLKMKFNSDIQPGG